MSKEQLAQLYPTIIPIAVVKYLYPSGATLYTFLTAKDGKKESGTLEVIKFYYDGAIRMEQHCYGEAATFVFGVWAEGMDADGTLHWALPDRRKSYYDEDYLPRKLDRVDEAGNLYFDGSPFPWKLADDFDEDKRWGYPKWKVLLGKLTGKGRKCD